MIQIPIIQMVRSGFTCQNNGSKNWKVYLSVFVLALHKDVLEEVVVMLLHLLVCHVRQMGSIRCLTNNSLL